MTQWFQDTALSGSLALAIPVAVIAGLVSFFSPCVIPLLPGYLSYATGLSGAEIAAGTGRRSRMLAGSVLFVLGFAVVFVALGVASASVVVWFQVNTRMLNLVLGVICIAMGVVFLGLLRGLPGFSWLQRDLRVHQVPAVGLLAAPLLGALFAVGWLPCVGPTLGVIYSLGINEGSGARSGVLLGFYSLGLGAPFIVAALAWKRAMTAISFVRRHQLWVTRFGGVMLVVVGVLLISGLWDQAVQWIQVRLVNGYQPSV